MSEFLHQNNYFTDPLHGIVIFIFLIYYFIYFANEFLFQIIGLAYPIFYIHRNTNKNDTLLKYLTVFVHINSFTLITSYFNYTFIHLKIILVIILWYTSRYRENMMDKIYNEIIAIDILVYNKLNQFITFINNEIQIFRKIN
jgi:hypothetical protein